MDKYKVEIGLSIKELEACKAGQKVFKAVVFDDCDKAEKSFEGLLEQTKGRAMLAAVLSVYTSTNEIISREEKILYDKISRYAYSDEAHPVTTLMGSSELKKLMIAMLNAKKCNLELIRMISEIVPEV